MRRYENQIQLHEIGNVGQQKLTDARVLVIGVGGLGCSVLQNLAIAGVGTIGIVDNDVIHETNLNRQCLFSIDDIGKNKVNVAKEAVRKQNPLIEIITHPIYFDDANGLKVASKYNIIVDCTDDIPTRYLINDVSVYLEIPMIYAALHKFEGQLSVFNYNGSATYRCLFPENDVLKVSKKCKDTGVLGVLPNVIGTLQANEVLKIILNIGEVSSDKLMLFNSLNNYFQSIEFKKDNKNIQIAKKRFKSVQNTSKSISVEQLFYRSINEEILLINISDIDEIIVEDLQIVNVNLNELEKFMLHVAKDQNIVFVCEQGVKSKLAVDFFTKKGFTNLYFLEERISEINNRLIESGKE